MSVNLSWDELTFWTYSSTVCINCGSSLILSIEFVFLEEVIFFSYLSKRLSTCNPSKRLLRNSAKVIWRMFFSPKLGNTSEI